MRFAGMAVALCLLLTGCGGDDATKASKTAAPTKKPTAVKTTAPIKSPIAAPTGTPAPEDLSDFLCAADDKGVWRASGILQNDNRKPVTYQVTVLVGQANGKEAKALTKQYAYVTAGGSINVQLDKIPAAKDASQCYVQVLAKP